MKSKFILLAFIFSVSSLWAKTGFYSGPFDPVSVEEVEIIKNSLADNSLDRCIVMIERLPSDSKSYNASASERLRMVKACLSDIGDRIIPIIEPWSGKETYVRDLQKQDEVHFIIRKTEKGIIQPSPINKFIEQKGLYSSTHERLLPLKKLLHEEAFSAFIREITLLFPNENLDNSCTPPFQPLMSNLARVDQFIYSVIREKRFGPHKATVFGEKAEKMLISTIRNEPYAKLHSLQRAHFDQQEKPQVTISTFELPKAPLEEKHTINIEVYCGDRFPKALINSKLFGENETYFHLGSTEEAIALHQSEGFSEVYEINSQAVRKLRNYHITKNPITQQVRFIVSNLNGKDTLQHVAYQFSVVSRFKTVRLVTHMNPCPLFKAVPHCEKISFQPTDMLIIGFKNAISRRLQKNPEWAHTMFSESGLHIDLYENARTKSRILLSKCVYGDQLLELLDYFYKKGIRHFHYFGTAGSLSEKLPIGSAIIPLSFSTPETPFLPFRNRAALLLKNLRNEKVKTVQLHGWVQSPVQETEKFLKDLQKKKIQSIDVEARYYGEFFRIHSSAFTSMVLFISDEPFGEITLEHFNTMDHYVDEAFNLVIDSVIPSLSDKETNTDCDCAA